jgi:hypothetical protein
MPPVRIKRSRALWQQANTSYAATLRAMLYEIQPIRFRDLEFRQYLSQLQSMAMGFVVFSRRLLVAVREVIRHLKLKHCLMLVAALAYYGLVRVIHEQLNAGPVALMITVLVLIFTVGLQDNDTSNGTRSLSAYHVFNRGMERMMGSLDAEELLAQHVGGGGAGLFMGMAAGGDRRHENDDDDFRARQPQVQAPAPRRQAQAANNGEEGAVAERGKNPARRSRKKARGEQRREIQRQREAAAELGMDEFEGDPVAMQQLIEQQILAQQQLQ